MDLSTKLSGIKMKYTNPILLLDTATSLSAADKNVYTDKTSKYMEDLNNISTNVILIEHYHKRRKPNLSRPGTFTKISHKTSFNKFRRIQVFQTMIGDHQKNKHSKNSWKNVG